MVQEPPFDLYSLALWMGERDPQREETPFLSPCHLPPVPVTAKRDDTGFLKSQQSGGQMGSGLGHPPTAGSGLQLSSPGQNRMSLVC